MNGASVEGGEEYEAKENDGEEHSAIYVLMAPTSVEERRKSKREMMARNELLFM